MFIVLCLALFVAFSLSFASDPAGPVADRAPFAGSPLDWTEEEQYADYVTQHWDAGGFIPEGKYEEWALSALRKAQSRTVSPDSPYAHRWPHFTRNYVQPPISRSSLITSAKMVAFRLRRERELDAAIKRMDRRGYGNPDQPTALEWAGLDE